MQALWKGHIPAQCLSICYGASQFVIFEALTSLITDRLVRNPIAHSALGGLSGAAATTIVFPFDVVRTRLVSQGEPKIYKNMTNAILTIYKNEGVKGFYRGISPTLVQIGPYVGAQFGFFVAFKDLVAYELQDSPLAQRPKALNSLIAGAMAGLCAKTLIYPFDLCKKRLQIQGFQHARASFGTFQTYSGLIDCFTTIRRKEGLTGFYKGLTPSILKAIAVTALQFTLYEQLCDYLRVSA